MPLTVRKFNAQVKDPTTGDTILAGLLSSDSLEAIEAAETAAVAAVGAKQAVSEAAIELKGATTLASIPADYTTLDNEVDDLKTQLINKETLPAWVNGAYYYSDGSTRDMNTRLRLTDFVSKDAEVGSAETVAGYEFAVYAWSIADDSYVGALQTSNTIAKESNVKWVTSFNFLDYPLYKFKLVLRNATDPTAIIAESEGSKCLFGITKFRDIEENQAKTDNNVSELENVLKGTQLFDSATATTGSYAINFTTGNVDTLEPSQPQFGCSDFIKIYPGAKYIINFSYYSSGYYGIAFYDPEKNYLSGNKQSADTSTSADVNFEFTAPDEASYCRFTFSTNLKPLGDIYLVSEIKTVFDRIAETTVINYYNDGAPIVNYYYDNSGEKVPSYADFTDILVNEIESRIVNVDFTSKTGTPNVRVVEYDEDGDFIQRQLINTTTSVTLDAQTKSFRLSIDMGPNSYFADLKVYANIANLTAIDTTARKQISKLEAKMPTEVYEHTYYGQSIKPLNYFNIATKVPENSIKAQGMACFGDIGVKAQMGGSPDYNLSTFTVFDMKTLSTIRDQIVPADSEGVGVLHCNTISFGNEYYDPSDDLPLLYCSGNGVRGIWAYRIDNEYNFTCVQKITFPDIEDMPTYKPCSCVDAQRGVLVASCNSTNASPFYGPDAGATYADNKQYYYLFRLPALSDGEEVQLSMADDLIKSFDLPAYTVRQGFQCVDGMIYHVFGNIASVTPLDPYIRLVCIDTDSEQVINVIKLNQYGLNDEPEGLCIYDGNIYIDFGHFAVFSFK